MTFLFVERDTAQRIVIGHDNGAEAGTSGRKLELQDDFRQREGRDGERTDGTGDQVHNFKICDTMQLECRLAW